MKIMGDVLAYDFAKDDLRIKVMLAEQYVYLTYSLHE